MKKSIGLLAAISVSLLAFQNCSDVGFSNGASEGTQQNQPPGSVDPTEIQESAGVDGGHFDLDTATLVYEDGGGDTNKHEHEYDDKHGTNVADFFNLLNDGFDNIQETVPADAAFFIVIGNGDLSPRVALEINGVNRSVQNSRFGPFSLDGQAGTTRLNSLRAIVASDAITNGGLVSTQTGCVVANNFSADGRYRNGALLFQAVPVSRINDLNPQTGTAPDNDALFWEGILFWHESGGDCR